MTTSSCARRKGTWTASPLGTLHPSPQHRPVPFRPTSTNWPRNWSTQSSRVAVGNALTSRTSWKTWNCAIKASPTWYSACFGTRWTHTFSRTWPQQSGPKLRAGSRAVLVPSVPPDDRSLFLWRRGSFAAGRRVPTAPATREPRPRTIPYGRSRVPGSASRNRPRSRTCPTASFTLNHIFIISVTRPSRIRRKRYRETDNGVAALEITRLGTACLAPRHTARFCMLFLTTLAEALNSPLPFINSTHADPRVRFPGPRNRILRNL